MFFSILFLVVGVLIGVAFLTLFERKVLGYIQLRKGPNKVGFTGILQPFGDAVKLFTKEQVYPLMSNYLFYYFSPIFNLYFSLMLWFCMPFLTYFFSMNYGILFFLCCSSLGVYTIMLAGWSSNSNYSLFGSLRSVAQTISYEVSLSLILLSFLFLIFSLSLMDFFSFQSNIWFFFICLPLCLMWLVTGLAETNRTPFDFAEGESELVSGFNVEYSSGGFALIFLSEYSNILFMSMFSCLIFFGGDYGSLFFVLKLLLFSFFWLWTRGSLPRYRYDKLMYLAWKVFLPSSLFFLLFYFGMKMLFLSLFC
uniref:NADH-ubiquinone oxidoreductase chain 1 n=1 Tax=Thaumaglossa rufocapillata TaxID=3080387 RepID=A0AA96WZV6_9COLE|nr:NADH dehydrogenase subunit 1 [Thaumaglossa rufocapillata]WNZ33701.1 NADH dehydrogenase subunit 1 [Thaumaglossa rufocapillata]